MSVLDSMKERLGFGGNDNWDNQGYDDYPEDGYDEDYEDGFDEDGDTRGNQDRYGSPRQDARRPTVKLVGRSENLSAPRSGRRSSQSGSYISSDGYGSDLSSTTGEPGFLKNRGSQSNAANAVRGRVSSLFSQSGAGRDDDMTDGYGSDAYGSQNSYREDAYTSYDPYQDYLGKSSTTSRPTPVLKTLSPHSYNEADQIADAFKTGSQVVVSLREVRPELAKRILDFSFGVACALDGKVEKIGDKVFLFSHGTTGLTDEQRHQLQRQGIL